jgi:hypothetical protein
MSRTASWLAAVALVALFAPPVPGQTQSEGLLLPSPAGAVSVNCAVAGSDLGLTVTFPSPVKTYLVPDRPSLSLTVFFDTDKNVRTGFALADDARRGADYSVDLTVRLSGGEVRASEDDVTVVQLNAASSFGTLVPAKSSIRVDGSKVEVLVPLAAMKLRKGRTVRVAAQTAAGDYVEQTIELK